MNGRDYRDPYNADTVLEKFKGIQSRTEQNQRDLSDILRRDPSSENFNKVYAIVESLHIREGGGEKLFKADYQNNPYINFICTKMKPNSKVLEIGCGTGDFSFILARKGHEVLGIDSSPACIELALKKKETEDHLAVNFELFDCRDFKDLKSEYFDYAVSDQVIEHIGLSGFISSLEHLSRVLKKGGKYFISCPSALRSCDEGDLHLKIFYFSELRHIAKMLKFDIEFIFGFKGLIYIILPKWLNPLISAYEQTLRLTRLNFIFNYFDIIFPCIPMTVVLTKTMSNAEKIRRREAIFAMQQKGLYRC